MIRPGDFVVDAQGEEKLVIEVSGSELTFSGSTKWVGSRGWVSTGKSLIPPPSAFTVPFSSYMMDKAVEWAVKAGKASWLIPTSSRT